MAATPEGRVKQAVRDLLEQHGAYYYMPVPTGYGRKTLDFIGCHHGLFYAVETKAPGKKPTALQRAAIEELRAHGAFVFVIDNVLGTNQLEAFLYLAELRMS
jgi:hypothetical protein